MAENIKKSNKTTKNYQCYRDYRDNFYVSSNLEKVLKESRDYYAGHHYADVGDDAPKPTFNIIREGVEKVASKLLTTTPYFAFVGDTDDINCNKIGQYYEYLLSRINNNRYRTQVVRRALIDGVGILATSYDSDTHKGRGLFKGFLKRKVIPIEDMFFANPYCEELQDQEYVGYVMALPIKEIKKMVEGKNKADVEAKKKLIVPETYDLNGQDADIDYTKIDFEVCNLYVRFFRIEGDVYFTFETKYCSLFETAHSLNPLNNKKVELSKNKDDDKSELSRDKEERDFDIDPQKSTLPSYKLEKMNDEKYSKQQQKFDLYPFSVFKPYPIANCVLGESFASLLIDNNKIIDYTFLLIILIMQTHAMPKYLARPDSLRDQEINNDPNQLLIDYTSRQYGSNWGITRLESGAVNSNIFEIGTAFINLTKDINGFSNILNSNGEKSGYAFQQEVKQSNLMWEEPLKDLYNFDKDQAELDLEYMAHYIDKAYYTVESSEGDMKLNESYRTQLEAMKQTGNAPELVNIELKPLKKYERKEIDSEVFNANFDVIIDVESGIVNSEITESQQYGEVFQMIAQNSMNADKIIALIENDPRFSNKLRASLKNSLKALENSQLQEKDKAIEMLKQEIQKITSEATNTISLLKQANDFTNRKYKALEQAQNERNAINSALLKEAQNQYGKMSESEVKSNNAKGISGGSFAGGGNETINNTNI